MIHIVLGKKSRVVYCKDLYWDILLLYIFINDIFNFIDKFKLANYTDVTSVIQWKLLVLLNIFKSKIKGWKFAQAG